MVAPVHLDLIPLKPADIPDSQSPEFQQFLDAHFEVGIQLVESMADWRIGAVKHDGTVQIVDLPSSSSYNNIRKKFNVKEYWCGRQTYHTQDPVSHPALSASGRDSTSLNPAALVRGFSQNFAKKPEVPTNADETLNGSAVDDEAESDLTEAERQAKVMSTTPAGLYERFRRGLLEYHSENEREYIESMRETECLHVYQKHVAEVWRLTYKTPPPTNPRTFVVLLLSRELQGDPNSNGGREFMNISIPFIHPDCPEKQGGEKNRTRGKYVSVERVKERDGGKEVEWKMATSSDAGGNIPRFVTNSSLPSSIAEDVPSFIQWIVKRFPAGGQVASRPASASA